jgi:hypothetical protein
VTSYGKTLPFTGGAISLFGIMIDQLWLAVAAIGLVAIGAVAIRLTFRRGKNASDA